MVGDLELYFIQKLLQQDKIIKYLVEPQQKFLSAGTYEDQPSK